MSHERMSLINGYVLRKIRAQAEAMMTQVCTIYRQTDAQGSMGQTLTTRETVAAGVPCRVILEDARGDTQMAQAQESLTERYRLIVPYDTELAVDMTVAVQGDDRVYQVIAIRHSHTDATDRQATIVVRNG